MRRRLGACLAAGVLGLPAGALALDDPMRPAVVAAPAAPADATAAPLREYVVQGIKIDGARRAALIDGRLVAEGASLGRERVLKIEPTAVVIGDGEGHRKIQFNVQDIKLPASAAR